MMGDELSIKDVMHILKVSKPTVYKLMREGHLPYRRRLIGPRHGQRIFFDRGQVEQLKTRLIFRRQGGVE